jgi:2-hydroxy-6-oxonona-2,4-dienedioate hydrolase
VNVLRWFAIIVGGLLAVLLLAVAAAAATDRPDDEVISVDPDDADVAAYLDAEAALLAHHDVAFEERTVELDDPALALRVLEVGEGPPVVVVPGDSGEAARYAPLLAELDGWRFLLINRPGGGTSDTIDHRAVDVRELAVATLDAVYDAFDLEEAPVVANSVGGTWAWWYALERPERVTSTVQMGAPALVDGTRFPPELRTLGIPGLNRLLLPLAQPSGPDDAAEVYAFLGHPDATVEATSPELREYEYRTKRLPTYRLAWRSHVEAVTGPLGSFSEEFRIREDELSRLGAPALLLWPATDPFGDVDAAHRVAGMLPDAELHLVGSGHFPWLDDPAGAARLIDDHLGSVSGE